MKKFKVIVIGLLLGVTTLITGCKNFLNGGDFLDSLNEDVTYYSNDYISVTIAGDIDEIKEIHPALNTYTKEYKETDVIVASVVEKKEYAFWYWSVTPSENIEWLNEGKEFDSEIKVKIIKGEKPIVIKPVCVQRPTVELLPEYRSDGVPKNSSIVLQFSNPLVLQESTIDDIKINCGGTDYKEYFGEPVLSEDKKEITFASIRDKLIPGFAGVKSIDVIVPQDFSYNANTEESPFLVSFNEKKELTYRINNNTIEQIKVTGVDLPEKGSLTMTGIDTLNFDEQVSYYFAANKEYVVVDWFVQDKDGNDISTELVAQEKSDDYKSITLTFKAALPGIDEIFLTPDVQLKQKLIVNFKSDHATLVPSEQKIYYTGDEFTIDCREESNYFFVSWKVYDNEEKEITDYSKYIVIPDSGIYKQNTSVKVINGGKEITFKPTLIKRPNIVSVTPLYDSEGVYKDRRLTVMFDEKINESSIYYSDDEVSKWSDDYIALRIGDKAFYDDKTGAIPGGKVYGYYKKDENENPILNSIVYKAFEITKLNEKDVNLLQYYGEPIFDDGNTGVLRLGPRSSTIVPPGSTDILVTVKKDVGLLISRTGNENDKEIIGLPSDYKWAYYTNQKADNEAPTFNDVEIWIPKTGKTEYSEMKVGGQQLGDTINLGNITEGVNDYSKIPVINAKDSKLWVKATIVDSGSGPASLKANIYREHESFIDTIYPDTTNSNGVYCISCQIELVKEGQNAYAGINANEASNITRDGTIINLVEAENSLTEPGLYSIELEAMDKNGVPGKYKKYYFIWDVEKPVKSGIVLSEIRKEAEKTTISWKGSSSKDVKTYRIERYAADDENFEHVLSNDNTNGNTFKEITNLVDQVKYRYKIFTQDYAGNESEDSLNWIYTGKPNINDLTSLSENLYFSYEDGKVNINIKTNNELAFGHPKITYRKTYKDTQESRSFDCWNKIINNETLEEIKVPVYRNGHQYSFYITITDYHGNESDPIEFKTDTYIIEDAEQITAKNVVTNDEAIIGDICYKGTNVAYSSLVDVIPYEQNPNGKKYNLYGENKESVTFLLSDEANKVHRKPAIFTNTRTNFVTDGTITLKPYQIGKYEFVHNLYARVSKLTGSKDLTETKPLMGKDTFKESIYISNTLSIDCGFKPCYTAKLNGSEETVYPDVNNKDNINWDTVVCNFFNNGYRLPSELEWECAARSGDQKRYDSEYNLYVWFTAWSTKADGNTYDFGLGGKLNWSGRVYDVHSCTPNYLEIYNMGGNAREWCWDAVKKGESYSLLTLYGGYTYTNGPSEGQITEDAKMGLSGPFPLNGNRVARGGSYGDNFDQLVTYAQFVHNASTGDKANGFRLTRTLTAEQEQY